MRSRLCPHPPPAPVPLAVILRAEDDRAAGYRARYHGGLMPHHSWYGGPPTREGRCCAACGAPQVVAPEPASGMRRPFPVRTAALLVIAAVCLLAAVATGCASGGGGTAVMESAPPTGGPRTPFPAATKSMSEGRSGLRIVSVVPPPYAMGPWTGADVIVAYLPAGARVVPSRCKLTVNGRRQRARIGASMLSPVQPILIFSWTVPYPSGNYRFRVTVVTRAGKTAVAEWTYAYR